MKVVGNTLKAIAKYYKLRAQVIWNNIILVKITHR